jgi:hypothetical protein
VDDEAKIRVSTWLSTPPGIPLPSPYIPNNAISSLLSLIIIFLALPPVLDGCPLHAGPLRQTCLFVILIVDGASVRGLASPDGGLDVFPHSLPSSYPHTSGGYRLWT